MNITVPYNPGSTFLDNDLEHASSSESANESQHFPPSLTPFYDLSSDELLEDLWGEGVIQRFKPPYSPMKRGNYVRNYVLSKLRIQAKLTRLKVGWNLEALWNTFPVELVISIFKFLHPIDLYHAILATKSLRRFLLDKNSTTIWKESFLNHPDIPFYPPDVSAPKWASLIFGPATCDECGAGNTLVDYAFRVRRCHGCMNIVYSNEVVLNAIKPIIAEFDDQLGIIWSLTMEVYRFDSFSYANLRRHRYSMKDVMDRAHDMRKYLLDIRSGVTDAHAKYQTFLSVTGATIQECMEYARRCEIWAQDIYARSERAFVASVPAFLTINRKALLKQGYHPRDVKKVQDGLEARMLSKDHWIKLSDPVLGRSTLRRYFLRLKLITEKYRATRLRIELPQRIHTRERTIDVCYWNTIKSYVIPMHARFLPVPAKLYTLEFFADYIHHPQESVGELDAFSAQQQIKQFILTYVATKQRRLLTTLLNTGLLPKEATEISNPDDFLGLAIAVFECCRNSVFFGWEDEYIHVCIGVGIKKANYVNPAVSFSNIGHQVLKKLAELLHLDLRSLLAKDLDTLNKRFICKTCSFDREAGLHGLHSMTWRECLTHAKQGYHFPREDPHTVFDVISETLTNSILAFEEPFPPPTDANWACNLCKSYINFERVKKAKAIAHVKTVHGIAKPVGDVDFVYCRTESCPKRSPIFIALDENSNHRCMRCPSLRSLRLWKKTPDLFRHILDKHAIQSKDLVEGVDWIKVKAVEDDTWIEEKMRIEGIVSA